LYQYRTYALDVTLQITAYGMQITFPSLTQARCSATISPQRAHGTDRKIFARSGISGFTSLIRKSSPTSIVRILVDRAGLGASGKIEHVSLHVDELRIIKTVIIQNAPRKKGDNPDLT